ncbi:MAG: site-2 protease family protein [Candidatus Pacebacteria bacterium]|nr:site-2 protease family protein [Candidatus Paceibacterota bacterium]
MNIQNIIFVVVLIISVVLHEIAHGYAADKLGDPTARLQGRLSLNPLVHLDWLGSVILPFLLIVSGAPFVLGWAKPVPFNPYNMKNPKWGGAIVAIAGPLTNIAIAIVGAITLQLFSFSAGALFFITSVIITNIALAVFNLVPIPPLDGHHILYALLPSRFNHIKDFLRRYSFIILIIFVVYGWQFISPIILGLYNILV